MGFVKSHLEKMKLWPVQHFLQNPYFSKELVKLLENFIEIQFLKDISLIVMVLSKRNAVAVGPDH